MTPAAEQQRLNSLAETSQNIKVLLTLAMDLARNQNEANEKACGQLVNMAHKR